MISESFSNWLSEAANNGEATAKMWDTADWSDYVKFAKAINKLDPFQHDNGEDSRTFNRIVVNAAENPFSYHGAILMDEYTVYQYVWGAKDDQGSLSLAMRALEPDCKEMFGYGKPIVVATPQRGPRIAVGAKSMDIYAHIKDRQFDYTKMYEWMKKSGALKHQFL